METFLGKNKDTQELPYTAMNKTRERFLYKIIILYGVLLLQDLHYTYGKSVTVVHLDIVHSACTLRASIKPVHVALTKSTSQAKNGSLLLPTLATFIHFNSTYA